MATDKLRCWNCGESLAEVLRPISRHEHCMQCFEALHCCRLCRFYRADATDQCDEERADPPVTKENANFCEWFRPDSTAFVGSRVDRSDAAKDRLSALFGEPAGDNAAGEADIQPDIQPDNEGTDLAASKPPAVNVEDAARSRLDDLFSKD